MRTNIMSLALVLLLLLSVFTVSTFSAAVTGGNPERINLVVTIGDSKSNENIHIKASAAPTFTTELPDDGVNIVLSVWGIVGLLFASVSLLLFGLVTNSASISAAGIVGAFTALVEWPYAYTVEYLDEG